jgi:hypothetical protein
MKTSTLTREDVVGLATLQFAMGGLFDARPTSTHIHLVRHTAGGTPGDTLCGLPRFGDACKAGWSINGGITGPNYTHDGCRECILAANTLYPGIAVDASSTFRSVFTNHVGITTPTRPVTPPRENEDGSKTITVQRVCNGCGRRLGDATDTELDAAVSGAPLPDTTNECGCN